MKDYRVTLLIDGYDSIRKRHNTAASREAEDAAESLFRQKDYGCLRDITWKIDEKGSDINTIWAYFRGKADLTVNAEDKETASAKALKECRGLDFGELLMSTVTIDILSIEEKKP